jgi:hypothetical protein
MVEIGEGVGTSNFTTTTGDYFQNVENVFWVDHYYDITTSKMSFELITTTTSQCRKCLLSWSLLRHHNVENVFLVHHYYENQNVEKN